MGDGDGYTTMQVGTSLVVQWLRPHAPHAGALGSIPAQGTRSRRPQLRAGVPMTEVTIHSDFGAQEISSVTVSIVFPSICHEVMGLDAMIFIF